MMTSPSLVPSKVPSVTPSIVPTDMPSIEPSLRLTCLPSGSPTQCKLLCLGSMDWSLLRLVYWLLSNILILVCGLDENLTIEFIAFLTIILFSLFTNDSLQLFVRANSIWDWPIVGSSPRAWFMYVDVMIIFQLNHFSFSFCKW
jgi:hypothetical protein